MCSVRLSGKMIKSKYILTAVLVSALACFSNSANANDLIKMDVKRLSGVDSVGVTFYTTGDAVNTVVTRKDNNKYVVLLPNVSGTSSVAPNIGGVKDLITDINVKNVNDGIGGYTKVTFSTTKPLSIQTHTQKTAPLTQAQQEYKNLIARNSMYDPDKKIENTKKAQNTQKAEPVSPSTASKIVTKTTQKPAIANTKTQPAVLNTSKKDSKTNTNTTQKEKNNQSPAVYTQKIAPEIKNVINEEPKMKFDQNGKRLVDLEPKIDHKASSSTQKVENIQEGNTTKQENPVINEFSNQNQVAQKEQKENKSLPIIPLAGGLSVLGIFVLLGIINIITKAIAKNSDNFKNLFEIKDAPKHNNSREFPEIMQDNKLSWQERFRHYAEKENDLAKTEDLSYITDLPVETQSGNYIDGDIEIIEETPEDNVLRNITKINSNSTKNIPRVKVTTAEDMKARISRMEHALSQTPSMEGPQDFDNSVKSEDNSIIKSMSKIKLRSFAKNMDLENTNRHILQNEKRVSEPKLKEGHFVKLRNSELSTSRRKSSASRYGFSISDLIKKGNKYLTNDGVESMDELNENYTTASLNEYLSMLDSSEADLTSNNNSSEYMTRSVATNPIANTRKMPNSSGTSEIGGLIVKSGYDIDEKRGIYLVNLDGISALVGKVGEDIFILKKFDQIIDQKLQVRRDTDSVYIVKVGGFKSLVEVSDEKIGTLLEI